MITRIFTDLATIDITPAGLHVREKVEWISSEELQARTAAPLTF